VGALPWPTTAMLATYPTSSGRASAAWAKTTTPMPITLPASSCRGRTAASSTSTTRLDFSSMTPTSVHVRYW
jgi:hypothetical protein